MSLSEEAMAAVIRISRDPVEAAAKIAEYSSRQRRFRALEQRITHIHDTAQRQISEEREKLMCPHELTKTHSDPAGDGSWRECLICGKCL